MSKEANIAKFQKIRPRLHLDRNFKFSRNAKFVSMKKPQTTTETLLVSVELTELCSCNKYK